MPNPVIKLSKVTYTPDNNANGPALINQFSCAIEQQGVTAIMGPNGAGKSLILRLIAHLLQPSSGQVSWFGNDSLTKNDLAIVFQKPVMLRRSVKANLQHALKTYGLASNEQEIDRLLDMAQLSEIAERPARVLSGGEQQRLAMVRALAAKPKILLLDEATASLDPSSTLMIENLIKEAKNNGVKIIITTHDQGQAKRISDDVIFINNGKFVEHTPIGQFLRKPKSKEASAYLKGDLIT